MFLALPPGTCPSVLTQGRCACSMFWKRCWQVYVLDAILTCFRIFRFGPTWEEALCMFEQKTVYKRCWHVLACFAAACARNDAGTFTFWKQCWHVLYVSGQVLFSSFVVVAPVAVGQAWLCWFCTMCLSRLH